MKFTTVPGEEFTLKHRALMIIKAFHDSDITPAIKARGSIQITSTPSTAKGAAKFALTVECKPCDKRGPQSAHSCRAV
ncbi:hypothetical protein HFO43_09515 [Rhizobium leguminosarum]|uniref:hypothetical protein n=1 Tax=Rhizobium leguminosarum TaxID=384 RepID=UPI001C96ED50|nr:hypothetical protein [Rhizobium leguminosarum]MBY5668782.1 hypothetical protein [Rhizobium leguminosarum]